MDGQRTQRLVVLQIVRISFDEAARKKKGRTVAGSARAERGRIYFLPGRTREIDPIASRQKINPSPFRSPLSAA
jgi:hypothetical protein